MSYSHGYFLANRLPNDQSSNEQARRLFFVPGRRNCKSRRVVYGTAIVAVMMFGLVFTPSDDAGKTSGNTDGLVGLAEVAKSLKDRAQKAADLGQKALLSDTLKKKTEGSFRVPIGCPGYGMFCNLSYPMPYKYEEWPETYDYQGDFPDDFVWGFGTAAYQIEGSYRDDGRGASIWDTFSGANTIGMPGANCSYCCKEAPCDINPGMFDKGATGNVASDSYKLYKVDIALMKSMGLKHYRFSISWPRLVPTGKTKDGVNEKATKFYNDFINALLEAGITPYVTLYHWDLPQGLLDPPKFQGWWSRDKDGKPDGQIIPDFLDYVEICFKKFGDRVKTWVTFNEAWTFLYLGSGYGKAPGIPEYSDMAVDPWIGGHNVLNAHAAAVDLYRRRFQKNQGGQIGITNNCDWREPKTESPMDVAAAERAVLFQLGWFSDPIFGKAGDYPPEMRKVYGKQLPEFTDEQKRLLKGSADFYGLNHYGTGWATYSVIPGDDLAFATVSEDGFPRALSIWLYGSGWGFRKILNWVARRYDNPPLFVTEGGWSLPADNADEAVADHARVMYYANYTAEMLKAIKKDKIDVRGYFAWSFLDNYEWERGYGERFGSVYTEFNYGLDKYAAANRHQQPTSGKQWRRRKNSSCWIEQVMKGKTMVHPEQDFQGCVGSDAFDGTFDNGGKDNCVTKIKVLKNGMAVLSGTEPRTADRKWCGGPKQIACPIAPKCDGKNDQEWTISGVKVSGGSIIADFSSRGGTSHFAGFWHVHTNSIEWQDGTSWKAIGDSQVA